MSGASGAARGEPASQRRFPEFGLCGLNCGLCPRYRTDGSSRCPGCGGPGFRDLHPACAVMGCARRHGGADYCFECADYPCARHERAGEADSFITYRNLMADLETARSGGVEAYVASLRRKMAILDILLARFDDGRRKGFFCLAANLLPLADLEEAIAELTSAADANAGPDPKDAAKVSADKAVAARAVRILEDKSAARGIELRLRKAGK